ncbi:MAG: PAS domain S-box protein [Zoogloea sp.]|nr:PAS domain S-box protein [Zoogloea sp.]
MRTPEVSFHERRLLDLARRVSEAQSALRAAAGGQVDAVADQNGGSFTLLHGAQAALLESEEQFRLIADGSTDLISMVSMDDGRFLYLSPSHEALLGYPLDTLM